MKKTSKTLLALSLFGLAATALASCQETTANQIANNGLVNEQNADAVSYTITNADADHAYLDGLPATGKAGEEYSFRVSLKPGYHFNDKLTITSGDEAYEYTYAAPYYKFTMPSANIVIDLDLGETDFTITNTSYFIDEVYLDDGKEELTAVRSAVAGTKLKFQATPDDDFDFTKITLNGVELEEKEGYYHFEMPARPAILASDKNAIAYDLSFAEELTTCTAIFYVDAELKTPVTTAIKGERVYVKFTPNEGVVKAKYSVIAKPENSTGLYVTAVDGEDYTYSFEMVSDNVVLTVTEKDLTPYMSSLFVNKEWRGYAVSSTGVTISSKTYSSISYPTYKFNEDGTLTYKALQYGSSSTASWYVDDNATNKMHYEFKSYNSTYKVYGVATDNLAAIQYSYGYSAGDWKDVVFCIKDGTYDLHYMSFASTYRLAWLQDETGAIVDSIYVDSANSIIKTGITVKKADGTVALGSDITKTSIFNIYDGETKLVSVSSGELAVESDITVSAADDVACVAKDADGNILTKAFNGTTIYLHETLNDTAGEYTALKTPKVEDASGKSVTVTKVEEGLYSFVMPQSAVTVTPQTKDMSKYLNYPVIGKYFMYELYSSNSYDRDFSTFTSYIQLLLDVQSSGDVEQRKARTSGTGTECDYAITSLENTESGVMKMKQEGASSERSVTYGDDMIVTPWSAGGTSYGDVYVGIKLPDGKTYADVSTKVHFAMKDGASATSTSNNIWAISFYISNELAGSIFCYKDEVYTGVTFTYEEDSTRISSTSSYHVYKGEEKLFDVADNVVTKATAEAAGE